jgi:hypothetical protein
LRDPQDILQRDQQADPGETRTELAVRAASAGEQPRRHGEHAQQRCQDAVALDDPGDRLGAVTIFVGTAATASGPHAGGSGTGDVVHRLSFKGAEAEERPRGAGGRQVAGRRLVAERGSRPPRQRPAATRITMETP